LFVLIDDFYFKKVTTNNMMLLQNIMIKITGLFLQISQVKTIYLEKHK